MANKSTQTNGIRIVVAGDRGTGKSSLIVTAVSDTFPKNVPPVLPPSRLPDDLFPERVPITIIDTASGVEHTIRRAEEFKRADAVVLTYACNNRETLESLSSYWLPELRRLEVKAPIVVVGCKLDLRDEDEDDSLEQVMTPIMQQFREIETCIECSASRLIQISDVFYYAQKAVIHPTAPLFDQETQTLRSQCVKALKRIFILCDLDRDGALSNAELNEFQVKCFNAPLQPSELIGVKRVVQEKMPEGVNERGLTLRGFLFLHALFIEKGRLETTWTVLRKFGYNNDIRLDDDFLPPSFKRSPDQSVELSNHAVDFLKWAFSVYDDDNDGTMCPAEVNDLFSTAPDCPWSEAPYRGAASTTESGGLTLHGFLSEWALMTLLEPAKSVEYLKYIMYGGDATSAIRLTRRRRTDRKKSQSERDVYQCFVFGPNNSGKSALLDAFLRRPFTDAYSHNIEDRYAVNVVDGLTGSQKFLVLREIPEDKVKNLLSDKESLAACDVALFVYDSTDELSFKKTAELLVEVAGHGEDTGYEVPSLIVSAKDDELSYSTSIQDSTRLSQDMGINAPVPISAKLQDCSNIFQKIVTTAQQPHLSIPVTEAGRSKKQYLRLVNRSLMVVSVATAVGIAGLAAYRVYAARRNTSS